MSMNVSLFLCPTAVSDFLLYTLGLRDPVELDEMIRQFINEENITTPRIWKLSLMKISWASNLNWSTVRITMYTTVSIRSMD